jgi:hypothetical protein
MNDAKQDFKIKVFPRRILLMRSDLDIWRTLRASLKVLALFFADTRNISSQLGLQEFIPR